MWHIENIRWNKVLHTTQNVPILAWAKFAILCHAKHKDGGTTLSTRQF